MSSLTSNQQPQSNDKKISDEKRYSILSRETVKSFAEQSGYADLGDDVAAVLAEDVCYRLREVTQNCVKFMKHSRRKKLTSDDFNKALLFMDVEQIHGHGSPDQFNFRQTKDGELHFLEDQEINLMDEALDDIQIHSPGQTSVKAHWLSVEGLTKSGNIPQHVGKPSSKINKVSDDLLLYYEQITKAILSNDESLVKVALNDLRSNSKICPLLSYFVNFVHSGIKKVSHDISKLWKLLQTANSIICNKHLYIEPQPYLNLLTQSIMYIITEPLAASMNPLNDHWIVRDYAARLLAKLTLQWNNNINQLKLKQMQAFREILHDVARPFCSHYGAVVGLTALGNEAVEKVLLPNFCNYCTHLMTVMDDTTYANAMGMTDARMVHGVLLMAVQNVLRQALFDVKVSSAEIPKTKRIFSKEKKYSKLYQELYDYFGDELSGHLPCLVEPLVKLKKRENGLIKLGAHHNDEKSGEELLQDLLKVEVHDIEMKSEHSYRSQEDLDIDGDSNHSERSFHSDNLSFLDDPSVDLTVKSTINEPGLGIKLTISKRRKISTPEPQPIKSKSPEKAKVDIKRRKRRQYPIDLFDRVPFIQNDFCMDFDVIGFKKIQIRPRDKIFLIDNSRYEPTIYHNLALSLPVKGTSKILKNKHYLRYDSAFPIAFIL